MVLEFFIVAVIGGIVGYFIGKSKRSQSVDLSSQMGIISGLSTQLAEMKVKFSEIEEARSKLDKEREKREEEKDKRFKEFIEENQKRFTEIKENSDKSDKEKEVRLKEMMESNERFFEEQGKGREENEKQRNAQIKDMKVLIEGFTQTISGTKKRGLIGELFLGEVLKNSIRVGVVKKELKIGSKNVEFAWDLGDGKYIPIDSKFPDIFKLYQEYLNTKEGDKIKKIKKKIRDKIKKNIKEIQKYQNQTNTIDTCIIVLPSSIIEICPEVLEEGKEKNVFICSYSEIFPVAHTLKEQYIRMKEEGEVGVYKKMVKQLMGILNKIMSKTESIDMALTRITNANNDIKEEVGKSKRL